MSQEILGDGRGHNVLIFNAIFVFDCINIRAYGGF